MIPLKKKMKMIQEYFEVSQYNYNLFPQYPEKKIF